MKPDSEGIGDQMLSSILAGWVLGTATGIGFILGVLFCLLVTR